MPTVRVKGVKNAIEFPYDMNAGKILSVLRKKFSTVAEPAAAIVTSALAEPISGLLSLPIAFGDDVDSAVKAQKNIQEWLTYTPKTKEGMEGLQAVVDILQPVAEVMELSSEAAGDYIFEKTGSPALSAIAYSAPAAVLEVIGLKGARTASKAGYLGKELELSGASSDGKSAGLNNQIGALGNVSARRTSDPFVNRLIDTGFLNGDLISAQNIKNATNKYISTMKDNRAFSARERIAEANEFSNIIKPLTDKTQRKIITPEDLLNEVLVGTKGDRMIVADVEQIGGIPMNENVFAHGGIDYPLKNRDNTRSILGPDGLPLNADAGQGVGWASAKSIAEGRQRAYANAAEQTGKAPLAAYDAMGAQAIDFATPVSEVMLLQSQSLPIPKNVKDAFDDDLRTLTNNEGVLQFPNWLGIDNAESLNQLKSADGGPRKAFERLMGDKKYRDQGFPLYHEIVGALTENRLRDTNTFDMGANFFDTDPNAKAFPTNEQSSYDSGIPMKPGGRVMGLENDYPLEVMMPDSYAAMKLKRDKKGKLYKDAFAKVAVLDTQTGSDFYQKVDEKVVQGMLDYDKQRKINNEMSSPDNLPMKISSKDLQSSKNKILEDGAKKPAKKASK